MLASIIGQAASNNNEPDAALFQTKSEQQSSYTLNRSTGTLFVRAKASKIAAVSKLVAHYKAVLGRQVLIEAQILDVELSDQFRYGVDWNILRNNVAASYSRLPMQLGGITTTLPGAGNAGQSLIIPSTTLEGWIIHRSA